MIIIDVVYFFVFVFGKLKIGKCFIFRARKKNGFKKRGNFMSLRSNGNEHSVVMEQAVCLCD